MRIVLSFLLCLALAATPMHSMEGSSPEHEEDPMAYVPIEALAATLEEFIPEDICEDWLCNFCLGCFFIGMATQDGHNHL